MTSGSREALAVFLACWLASAPAFADTETTLKPLERSDPATISLPDMALTPGKTDIRRFDEYFYFHKSGVGYERAFADLDQCRMYSQMVQLVAPLPSYVPLDGSVSSQGFGNLIDFTTMIVIKDGRGDILML